MTRPCPSCNQPNLPEAAFCHNCAAPLGQAASQAPPKAAATGGAAGASQRAIIALVLAIGALICCGPFTGIPAAIVGWLELDAISKGQSSPAGKWMAQVGLWGGIACTLLHIVLYIIYVGLSLMAASDPYYY